ncbi:MAG: hypothetical protein EPN93_05105 [Spirochaetes bacterium]|nr:MAG: hypothetical protein EPN93_05105 [Spirochaetota bacterium]
MTEKSYIKEVIERPVTRGELEQSRRLKSLGVDAGDLAELHSRLARMRKDLKGEVQALEQKQEKSYAHEPPRTRRRKYDEYFFLTRPLGIFRQLFTYRKAKGMFIKKYGPVHVGKRISWSIWYLFTDGVLFFPSIAVYKFVQEIIQLQEDLRGHFRKMYSAGWLTDEGADVLTPYEFNLIAEAERLMSDLTVVNFLINFKHPGAAIDKMKPFIGYYLSITRDERTKREVREGVEKSLMRILYSEGTELRLVKKILAALDRFLDNSIDRELLEPLFECAFCRSFDTPEIRKFVRLHPVEMEVFRADPGLMDMMSARKKKFLEQIEQKAAMIEDKIMLVLDIFESIGAREESTATGKADYLEGMLNYAYHFNAKILAGKLRNVAIVLSDLCDIFFLQFASFLSDEVRIKRDNNMVMVRIFKGSLFSEEISKLEIERHLMAEFMKKAYGFDIFARQGLNSQETAFMNVVNSLVDAFYSIGIKLYTAIKGHHDQIEGERMETVEVPMDEKRTGSARIPFAEAILQSGYSAPGHAAVLANKTVLESAAEVKKFCFCLAYKFEHAHRDLTVGGRRETIEAMIEGLEGLYEKLQQLQKGENVE